MLKIIKLLTVLFWIVIFLLTLFAQSLHSYAYWVVLLAWILIVLSFKITSRGSYISCFLIFILSVILTEVNQLDFAEVTVRVSFICLIVGFFQDLKNKNY